jgi:phage recombination protein Bet
MTQTARSQAITRQDDAIANNVAKIEVTKRTPSALDIMASRLNVSATGLKNTLLNTVFKRASDDEFVALMIVANAYNLNPLTKEIYAFPAKGGGIVPVVSIDGWLRIMNDHPQFDGIEFEDIPDDEGKLIAVEAVIYRKDRTRPIKVTEYLSECIQQTDPWRKLPARMLRHKATIQCARYAFGFSGIYDEGDGSVIGDIQLAAETVPMRPAQWIEQQSVEREWLSAEEDEQIARTLDTNFNPQTGEIRSGEVTSEGGDDATNGHPAYLRMLAILAELETKMTIIDQNSFEKSVAAEINAMLDMDETREIGERIMDAFTQRKAALKGSK